MQKKKIRDSIAEFGRTLKEVPFGGVVAFVAVFSGILLTKIISDIAEPSLPTYAIITIAFIFGTGVLALLIQISAISIGKLLIWIGSRRVRHTRAKLDFSLEPNHDDLYLLIRNSERWYKAKDVYVLWDRFSATPNVTNEVFRQFTEWKKNAPILHWVKDTSTKKNNVIDIHRKKL